VVKLSKLSIVIVLQFILSVVFFILLESQLMSLLRESFKKFITIAVAGSDLSFQHLLLPIRALLSSLRNLQYQ
jgi:hypothetical protein